MALGLHHVRPPPPPLPFFPFPFPPPLVPPLPSAHAPSMSTSRGGPTLKPTVAGPPRCMRGHGLGLQYRAGAACPSLTRSVSETSVQLWSSQPPQGGEEGAARGHAFDGHGGRRRHGGRRDAGRRPLTRPPARHRPGAAPSPQRARGRLCLVARHWAALDRQGSAAPGSARQGLGSFPRLGSTGQVAFTPAWAADAASHRQDDRRRASPPPPPPWLNAARWRHAAICHTQYTQAHTSTWLRRRAASSVHSSLARVRPRPNLEPGADADGPLPLPPPPPPPPLLWGRDAPRHQVQGQAGLEPDQAPSDQQTRKGCAEPARPPTPPGRLPPRPHPASVPGRRPAAPVCAQQQIAMHRLPLVHVRLRAIVETRLDVECSLRRAMQVSCSCLRHCIARLCPGPCPSFPPTTPPPGPGSGPPTPSS